MLGEGPEDALGSRRPFGQRPPQVGDAPTGEGRHGRADEMEGMGVAAAELGQPPFVAITVARPAVSDAAGDARIETAVRASTA